MRNKDFVERELQINTALETVSIVEMVLCNYGFFGFSGMPVPVPSRALYHAVANNIAQGMGMFKEVRAQDICTTNEAFAPKENLAADRGPGAFEFSAA